MFIKYVPNSNQRNAVRRVAVTLVEVIFAVGVILIGLLGLMSVLPLAGQRGQSAVALNSAAILADNAFNTLIAADLLNAERLRTVTGGTVAFLAPVCIDPIKAAASDRTSVVNGYEALSFPHFKSNHNPLLDPSLAGDASVNWPVAAPRLVRLGMFNNSDASRVFTREEAFQLAESQDDLPLLRPKDRTQSATVSAFPIRNSGVLENGKRLATGDLSWFATLTPNSSSVTERFGNLSIVVVKKRDRLFDFPTIPVLLAENNANSERLALVTDMQGFQAGSGGVATLVSTSSLRSAIPAGSWLMLSRTSAAGPRHSWYRVGGIDGDTEFGLASDFNLTPLVPGATTLWRRRVLLDGPDWAFSLFNTSIPNNFTYATLVEGVVSVTERSVRIRN